jgi:hypothetical protein
MTQDRPDRPGVRTQTTRDHDTIRRWAAAHQATPATGEDTESGPATATVNDGGVGVRFNFPASSRFRPISWDEWLAHFDRDRLLFVFEEQDTPQVAQRAFDLSGASDHEAGHERRDWLQAERDLRRDAGGEGPSARYRFVVDSAT